MPTETRKDVVAPAGAEAEGEEGRSYVFLRALSGSKTQTIQSEIMQRLGAIMVGQKGAENGPEEATIQEDMTILNEYVWHLLTQEAATQGRLKKELAEFLQTNTDDFVSWLDSLLCRYDPEASASGDEEGALDGAETPPSHTHNSSDWKSRYRSEDISLSREEGRHSRRSSRRSAEPSQRSRHRSRRHEEERYEEEERHRRRHEGSGDRHRSCRRKEYEDRSRSPYSRRRERDFYSRRSPSEGRYRGTSHSERHMEEGRGGSSRPVREGGSRGRLIGLAMKQAVGCQRRSGGGLEGAEGPSPPTTFSEERRSRSRSAGRVRAIVLVDERSRHRAQAEGETGQHLEENKHAEVARNDGTGVNGAEGPGARTKAILRPNPRYTAGPGSPAVLSDVPFLSPHPAATPGGLLSPSEGLSRRPTRSSPSFAEPQYPPAFASFPPAGGDLEMEMGGVSALSNEADLSRGSAFLAVGGSAGPPLTRGPAGAPAPFAVGKVRKRCIKWPRCPYGANCMYIHPTAKCTKWPRCAFGDACFYWHPAVMCKFGAHCANPFCNYTHEPVDPTLAAEAASAVGASLPTEQVGASESPLSGGPAGSHGEKATGESFLGARGHDGFYRNKTWTPGQGDRQDSSSATMGGANLQTSVAALSDTLPGTPPELRRRREESFPSEKPLLLPPALSAQDAAAAPREGEEGVMEG
ncbi:hypothetical protein TGPRC2_308870 [Toxoplasma gondii TgCatPRC2]|uniref:C3H1-type domain-containing protein n=1 Tax=Toxoplasma gondii TgCatPRC2 TaxID=1130821 RepID=A0A151HLE3_TOXGO|nr:hypothetical protein TGPRC2_308870 [Toxoplasma gondii TgCatPRC2]